MTQRTPAETDSALSEARELVIKEGGTVHEDAVWDAAEMALDGQSIEIMAERIKKERAEPHKPRGSWTPTVGHN